MPDVLEMPYLPPLLDADPTPPPRKALCGAAGPFPPALAGDVIGDYGMDAVPQPGQTLVFGDMAIYTTCKNNTFNGCRCLPSGCGIRRQPCSAWRALATRISRPGWAAGLNDTISHCSCAGDFCGKKATNALTLWYNITYLDTSQGEEDPSMPLFDLGQPKAVRAVGGAEPDLLRRALLLLWRECRRAADYSLLRAEAVSRAEEYFAALAKPVTLDPDGSDPEAAQPTRDPHLLALGFAAAAAHRLADRAARRL